MIESFHYKESVYLPHFLSPSFSSFILILVTLVIHKCIIMKEQEKPVSFHDPSPGTTTVILYQFLILLWVYTFKQTVILIWELGDEREVFLLPKGKGENFKKITSKFCC